MLKHAQTIKYIICFYPLNCIYVGFLSFFKQISFEIRSWFYLKVQGNVETILKKKEQEPFKWLKSKGKYKTCYFLSALSLLSLEMLFQVTKIYVCLLFQH